MTMSAFANKEWSAVRWLTLAAAPSFAAMALISANAPPQLPLCAAAAGVLSIDGMTAMYGLMSLFHLPPWLALALRNRPISRN